MSKIAALLSILVIASFVLAACAPAAAPTATPTKAPAAAPTTSAAPTAAAQATKPAAVTPTAPAKALDPYKIGVVLALSGYYTAIGIPGRDGAMAAANEINAAGGINGRKLDLVVYDDGTDETKAVLAVKKAVNDDKVVAVVGPTGSGLPMAAMPVIEEAQVPMLAIGSGDSIVNPVKKWAFKFISGEAKNIPEIYSFFKSKGVKKLALLYPSTAVGKAGLGFIEPSASKEGFELVAIESYGPEDKDFAPQLTKLKSTGAQGLIVYDASIASALIGKQMKDMGISIPWSGPYGMIGPANVKAAGDGFDNLVVPAPKEYVANQLPDSDPQKKASLQFMEAYKKTTGKDADPLAMHGWDAVMIIAEALKKTNPDPANLADTRAKIRDGIEGLKNYAAVVSILNLSPTDHEGMPPGWSALVSVKDGKFSIAK